MYKKRFSPTAILLIFLAAIFLLYPCLCALHTCGGEDVCPICAWLCEVGKRAYSLPLLMYVLCPVGVLLSLNRRTDGNTPAPLTPTELMVKLSD